MIDFLDWIGRVLESGITWSSLVAAFVIFGNYQEKRHMRRLVYLIAEKVGVEWDTPQQELRKMVQRNYKRFYLLSHREIKPQKEIKKMNSQKINYITLIPTILGATKLILQTFGIDIPDETINEVINGAAAVGTIIGIFLTHKKGELTNADTKPTIDISANK